MRKKLILWIFAVLSGILIAFIDSRPGFDDTGITAGMIFLTSLFIGAIQPDRPWISATAVGCWIPFYGILRHQNYGSLLALGIAFLGAYAGALFRKLVSPRKHTSL